MKIYNVLGFATLALQLLLSAFLAPESIGPWWGMVIGFGYLLISWFIAGVYLSDMIHLGIAHRALDYKEWFIKSLTLVNNTVGVYVDPVSWVSRHRLHHKFADHGGGLVAVVLHGFIVGIAFQLEVCPLSGDAPVGHRVVEWCAVHNSTSDSVADLVLQQGTQDESQKRSNCTE